MLSRTLTRRISFLFYIVTRSKKWAIFLLAFLFLPGAIIHEFSHAIMAEVLFVKARHMELFPTIEGDTVKLGSVQIQQTDFIRRFFIGVAPFFVGTIFLLSLIWLTISGQFGSNVFLLILIGYAIFTISNTMFSSKRDMEGAIEFLIVFLIIVAVAYLAGLRPENLGASILEMSTELFRKATIFMLIPLGIDLVVIAVSGFFSRR